MSAPVSSPPFSVAQMAVRYDGLEDRLMLQITGVRGESVTLSITRRMSAALVNAVALRLEQSNPVAARAPEALRGDIILLEHQGILQEAAKQQAAAADAPSPSTETPTVSATHALSGTATLLKTIRLKTEPTCFLLVLGEIAVATLDRNQLHLILETIHQHAETAEWALPVTAGWLDPDESELVLN